jgi:uncharacterized protein
MTDIPEYVGAEEDAPQRPQHAPAASIANIGPDTWTAPYWKAARDHRLVAAKCASCGRFRMPPTPFCPNCLSQDTDWPNLSGNATVYSYTIVRHAVVPDLRDSVPYVLGIVDLDDAPGVRMMTNIVDCDPETVRVGQPVQVVWDDVTDDLTIPRFGPRS